MPMTIRSVILSDERGAALVLVAISMVALLAAASLAVDLGMARTARDEAQRVADAAALAGASAFIDEPSPLLAVDPAKLRAKSFAAMNFVRNLPVDTTTVSSTTFIDESVDMTVEVIPTEQKVRVWVSRQGLGTWFARVLGIQSLGIQAMAAAVASDGGTDKCLMPFWGLDIWDEFNGDTNPENELPDVGETWIYGDDTRDSYVMSRSDGTGSGFGSDHRNWSTDAQGNLYTRDRGRPFVIKAGSVGNTKDENPGGLETMVSPGMFLLWRLPDPDTDCQTFGSGGAFLKENIVECNTCEINFSATYSAPPEPGQTWGPVRDGINELMEREERTLVFDPTEGPDIDRDGRPDGAVVDQATNSIVDESPLIVAVALADPNQPAYLNGASTDIVFNNIAEVFLEGYSDADKVIYARFLGWGAGGAGNPTGSLVKYLRLVE